MPPNLQFDEDKYRMQQRIDQTSPSGAYSQQSALFQQKRTVYTCAFSVQGSPYSNSSVQSVTSPEMISAEASPRASGDHVAVRYEELVCWCSVAYFELNARVGEQFRVRESCALLLSAFV